MSATCGAVTTVMGTTYVCTLPRNHVSHVDGTAMWSGDERPLVPIAEVLAQLAAHPHGIPEGPAAIHFCPVPGCQDIWESEATCEHRPCGCDWDKAHGPICPDCGHFIPPGSTDDGASA